MATFGAMKTRIALEIGRSNITSQISAAILSAIEHHEREAYFFNELRTLTFNTVANQDYYTTADNAAIATLAKIIAVSVTISAGNVYTLQAWPWQVIEDAYSGNTDKGQPEAYAYFAQSIRIYPIPTAAWSVRVAYNNRLAALSADADTNAWTTEAEQLIRSRAKMILFNDVTYEEKRLVFAERQNAIAKAALDDETRKRIGATRLTPCGV